MDYPVRLAAIDVGTNSLRLVVAEVVSDGSLRVLDDEKVVTRLGRGLSAVGFLSADAMEQTVQGISRLRAIAEGYGVQHLDAIATCAVREASNGGEFAEMVREQANVDLRIIDAEEEAKLAFRSVCNAFDLRGMATAIVDIGGGSTEIVLAAGPMIEHIYTVPIGAVTLTEQFKLTDTVCDPVLKKMRRWLRKLMRDRIGKLNGTTQLVIGTGGTFTTLASMSMHRGVSSRDANLLPFSARGYELQRSELNYLLQMLRNMPLRNRVRVPGLSPDRADIIVAGLAIIDSVLRHLKVNDLRVHDQGIRTGLLLQLVDKIVPGNVQREAEPTDRLRSVRRFARMCRYEEAHSEHVAKLAMQIFDQLVEKLPGADAWGTDENRMILESAALLHKIGYYINYSKHHKHSYHLIVHSDLAGFTQHERELVANIARYHRRAYPKKKHDNFRKLSKKDRELVKILSAILRIANGLDRTHTQSIRNLHLTCTPHRVVFEAEAEHEPSVDLWGAERKSALFDTVFDLRARFTWSRGSSRYENQSSNGSALPEAPNARSAMPLSQQSAEEHLQRSSSGRDDERAGEW